MYDPPFPRSGGGREGKVRGGGANLLPGGLLRLSIFDQMQEGRGRCSGMRGS